MAENENVNEPEETPSGADPLDPEQAIVDEPVAESEELAAEETSIARGRPAADEELEYVEEVEAKPRVKPAIPGMDLEVDIVREGEEALAASRPRYSEDEPDEDEDSSPRARRSFRRRSPTRRSISPPAPATAPPASARPPSRA